jgi:NAD(P)-dependent dehydrogenase (short-subunit alcohol dehydrogenase family)
MAPLPKITNCVDMSLNVLVIGASRGIGLEFVRQLLADGRVQHLYATYRDADSPLLQIADGRLHCLAVDITSEAQIAAAAQAIQLTGKLHYAINCVGILHDDQLQPEKSLRHIETDRLLQYFQVNSIGAVLWAKHLQPLLKHDEKSVFASVSAKVGSIGDNQLGGWYGYRASKAALNMLMRNVSIEYRRTCPQAIVVLLHPGTTDTDLSKPFQGNVPAGKLFTVERTVRQLLMVITQLQSSDSGKFFNWDGTVLPW